MPRLIDRKSPEILAALAQAPIFSRHGFVKIRVATEGEKVVTKLSNGLEETTNIAGKNEWVVTNPTGEEWIIDADTFPFYEATNTPGVYISKGFCRAVTNPFGESIQMMSSWGELQVGDTDCMIADACSEDGTWTHGEPKIIAHEPFSQTFTIR